MDFLDFRDTKSINNFLEYFNNRQRRLASPKLLEHKDILNALDLISLHNGKFRPPKCSMINKNSTKKKRYIFIYPEEETLLLKYYNYIISRKDLGIHKFCISFQPGSKVYNTIKKLQSPSLHRFFCIKLDIENYFNSIDISSIHEWIPKELLNQDINQLILNETILNPKVIVKGEVVNMKMKGVMAGIPIAPLLSNLYLADFDEELSNLYPFYVRYADDMLIFCKEEQVQPCLELVEKLLMHKKLKINFGKTKVAKPGLGFDFLGLFIKPNCIDLSENTKLKMKSKIKRQSRRYHRRISKGELQIDKAIYYMNLKFKRKWYGKNADSTEFTWAYFFFPLITTTNGLKEIDQYYQRQVRTLPTGKNRKSNYKRVPYRKLVELGYIPLVSSYYKTFENKIN